MFPSVNKTYDQATPWPDALRYGASALPGRSTPGFWYCHFCSSHSWRPASLQAPKRGTFCARVRQRQFASQWWSDVTWFMCFCLEDNKCIHLQYELLAPWRRKTSGHYMYRTVVTICTASWTFSNSTFCQHSCICVLFGSENKQRLFRYTALTD
jgi:hypothetical protein